MHRSEPRRSQEVSMSNGCLSPSTSEVQYPLSNENGSRSFQTRSSLTSQVAKTNPGHPFNMKMAYKAMRGTKKELLDMCDDGMTPKDGAHLALMFVCPGLKTKRGLDGKYHITKSVIFVLLDYQ